MNSGIRDIQSLMTWWDSLSSIDRRSAAAKAHVLTIVEQAVLNESTSQTAEVANLVGTVRAYLPKPGDEDDSDKKQKSNKAEKSH